MFAGVRAALHPGNAFVPLSKICHPDRPQAVV